MSILDYFRNNKNSSANTANERLRIIVFQERRRNELGRNELDLGKLQEELIAVIRKYTQIKDNEVTVQVERNEKQSVLELNVVFRDDIGEEAY